MSPPSEWPICFTLYTSRINKVGQCCRPYSSYAPIDTRADPIYVSEVAEKVMNPNFRNIHFDSHDPQLMRLDELTLKFWAKSEAMSNYSLLIDMTLSMRSLQFIGKSVSPLSGVFNTSANRPATAIELPSSVPTKLRRVPSDRWLLHGFHGCSSR